MKLLIMCEGPNEKKIVDLLLEHDCLKYGIDEIKVGKRKYDNSTQFYSEYYGSNIQGLVNSIKEYQRVHGKAHAKDEHCLAELLK